MESTCEAAPEAQLSAFCVPGSPSVGPRLYITARGTVSDACWTVAMHMSPLRVWPPEFLLEARRVREVCPEVVTPYDVTQAFELGSVPSTVVVHDAAGSHEVQVEVTPDHRATLSDEPPPLDEVVGVSIGAASLTGALADAADKLYSGRHPNQPRRVRAIEISYSSGGIMPPVLSVRAKKV